MQRVDAGHFDSGEFASMNCAHELSPRLSRRQFRRCRQARRRWCRMLVHLREKPAAFRVIDTHAGAGRYDLAGPEAARSREWRDGIGRLRRPRRSASRRVRCSRPISTRSPPSTPGGGLTSYPGSPALVRSVAAPAGPADRLRARAARGGGARRASGRRPARQGDRDRRLDRAHRLCAAEGAARPRADRSAVRAAGRISRALARRSTAAHRKWPTGIYLLWYPIKDAARGRKPSRAACRGSASRKILRVELILPTRRAPTSGLRGSGLIVVNPPWTLARRAQGSAAGAGRGLSRELAAAPRRSIGWPANQHPDAVLPLSTRPALGLAYDCWL